MANPSKHKGTDFESGCVNYLRTVAGVEASRMPLHGSADVGDLSLTIHGRRFTAECKCVERKSANDVARFRLQATVESQNAGTDGGILLMWRKGKGYRWAASPTGTRAKSFGENDVQMTYETLMKVSGARGDIAVPEHALDTWVSISMADFALMCMEVDA